MVDRSIIINLQPIPEEDRQAEAEFWRAFEIDKPALLGALLDRVSRALRELSNTHLDKLPRMADFALWATAAETKAETENGTQRFITAYLDNRQSAIESGLEGSPLATALQDKLDQNPQLEGTATELLNALNEHVHERSRQMRSWPKSPKGFSSQLRRLATALRAVGIEVAFPTRHGQAKNLRIFASQPSHASQTKEEQLLKWDAKSRRDANDTAWDANHNELNRCSITEWDDGTQRDPRMHDFSKTNRSQWNEPAFEVIPNPREGIPWHDQYPPSSTTINGGRWDMRI